MNWISVEDKDRLPSRVAEVLVVDNHKQVTVGYWSTSIFNDRMYWHTEHRRYSNGDPLNFITHWMPKPPPPAEEE